MDLSTSIAVTEQLYFAAHSDVRMEVIRRIDMGEGWVLAEALAIGTDDGGHELLGWPVTNLPIESRVVWISQFDADGLMTYFHFYYDQLTEMVQLGLVEPPTSVLPTTWGQVKSLLQE